MVKRARRAYVVAVDVDGVPGWNGPTRPQDMERMIERMLVEAVPWYRPKVEYAGELEGDA